MDRIPHNLINVTLQRASYQLGDLLSTWPDSLKVFFLATAQLLINAYQPRLNSTDQFLFKYLVEYSETAILPNGLDPRKTAKRRGALWMSVKLVSDSEN